MARLALVAGRAARDIDRAGVQVVDEGLAVDAAGGEIHDLSHRVIGRIEGDAVQFFKSRAQLPIQRGNVCNAGAQLLLALRGGHAETHNEFALFLQSSLAHLLSL